MRAETIYLQFARNIKECCQSDASLRYGLCMLFNDELFKFNEGEGCPISSHHMMTTLWYLFRSWKGFSGHSVYPISIYQDVGEFHQFEMCMAFYSMSWFKRMFHKDRLFVKRYIKARRALLDHIINELEYKINGTI